MSRGFTLIGLSIALVIIAALLGGGIAMFIIKKHEAQYNATVNIMSNIEQALQSYEISFNRLPCPSSLTATATDPNYGLEAANPGIGNCAGAVPAVNALYQNRNNTYRVAEGGVPTTALKLPESYMYDGWGHRIRYAVDTSLTVLNSNASGSNSKGTNSNSTGGQSDDLCFPTPSGLTVYNYNGSPAIFHSNNAAYVLLSHGANGHGAYMPDGTILNANSNNAAELSNCHCTNTASSDAYKAQYYQEAAQYQNGHAGSSAYYYDDIVTFKEPSQMKESSSAASPECFYVIDAGRYGENDSALYYSTTLDNWKTNTPPGAQYITHMVKDAYGNIYVNDYLASAVYKYTLSTGAWSTFINSSDMPYTSSWMPTGLALDNNGNLYLSGYYFNGKFTDQAVQKYDSTGMKEGSPYNNSFNLPNNLFIDKNNNLWMLDSGNNNLQQCSLSTDCSTPSNWTTYGGGTGAAAGDFYNPAGIYVDTNGYIWIADTNNNRIQKCTTSPSFSCVTWPSDSTSVGNAPGQFNNPKALYGDTAGNIWDVEDASGQMRIQKYNGTSWNIIQSFPYANNLCNIYPVKAGAR